MGNGITMKILPIIYCVIFLCSVLFTGCVPRMKRDLPLYDSGAPLRVTSLTPTMRLNESAVLGFGGPLAVYNLPFSSPTVAPGMRASLFFSDRAGETISKDPACAIAAPPYPTTMCGAKVFISYSFEPPLTVVVPAPLVSVNVFDANRIDFIVPDPNHNPNHNQTIPPEFTLKSGAVLVEFNGRRNDLNDLENRQGPKPKITLDAEPSIFLDHWGRAMITRADESVVTELDSARPGERLTVWGTGFQVGFAPHAPSLEGWKGTMECGEKSEREVPILSVEQVANTPGVQKLTFEVPEPQGKVDKKGVCGLTLNQGGRSTFALLSVNAPPPAVERFESLFRYANGAPFSARSTTNNLVPGSFAALEFSNILCPGFLQGELAKAYPKPTEVCGVQFLFRGGSGAGGVAAPIYSSTFEPKILLQVPLELAGENRGTITVVVEGREKSSIPVTFADMKFLPLELRREKESPASKGFLPGETVQLNGIGL
jgi:hypothetical protein